VQEAWVVCPKCGEDVSGTWPSNDGQDVTEAPVAEQVCPACGHAWQETSPLWSFFTEAG
jgi:predicted RNA-binding Zn-ribbon protein involved in translation (DUF1610 family)